MLSFKSFLIEGRDDDFRAKVKGILTPEEIAYIIDNDPSPSKKYLKWIGQKITDVYDEDGHDKFHAEFWTPTSKSRIMDDIKLFDKKIKGKDIFTLKSFIELEDTVSEIPVSRKEQLEGDIDVIADTEDWLVVAPTSHEASQHYGGSTKWCISTGNEGYWEQYYNEQGQTVVMVKDRNATKNDDYWKVAFVAQIVHKLQNADAYDVKDHNLTMEEKKFFISKLPPEIVEDIIDYFDTKSDKASERSSEHDYKKWHDDLDRYLERRFAVEVANFLEKEYIPENEEFDITDDLNVSEMLIESLGGISELREAASEAFTQEVSNRGDYSEGFYQSLNYIFEDAEDFERFIAEEFEDEYVKEFNQEVKYINSFSEFYGDVVKTINSKLDNHDQGQFYSMTDFETDFDKYVFGKEVHQKSLQGLEHKGMPFHTAPTVNGIEDIIKFYEKIKANDVVDLLKYAPLKEATEHKEYPKTLTVYHGTSAKFTKFNLKMTTQGIIWFTSDKNKILKNEAGAQGKGYIITAEVTINKPAGWEEYDKLGLWELKREFDGVILTDGNEDNFDCFVFDPKQIKILKTEKV